MHILVSFCNLRAPGVPALGLLHPETGDFQVLELPGELARCSGLTGLAVCDRYVYAVAQPSEAGRDGQLGPSALLIFDRRDLSLRSHYAFRLGRDVHSLWVQDGTAYAVSTGTDEVLALRLRDDQVVSEASFWRPEPEGRREDVHHLNAIFCRDGELIVAGFGKKSEGSWSSAREGFITNISRGEPLVLGVDQPHSLAEVGGSLAYCESRKMTVRVIGDPRAQHLPGYTRGLCVLGGHLFVATSVGRQLSKSTGAINNPAAGGMLGGQCGISRLSVATFDIEQSVDLGVLAQEIYDLVPAEGAERWRGVGETAWRDTSIRALAALLDQRTVWAKQVTGALAQREAMVNDLQARLGKADALQREVKELHGEINGLRGEVKEFRESLDALDTKVEFLHVVASWALEKWAPDVAKQLSYRDHVRRVCRVATATLPAGATVLVASKGDDDLLRVEGRRAWHFPQTLNGVYSGSNPAGSVAAIAQLEALRIKGADFFLLPSTAFWWLEHYGGFKDHLYQRYREVVRQDDTCLICDLREPRVLTEPTGLASFDAIVRECEGRLGSPPAILDWETRADLAAAFPHRTILSPPTADRVLPYLDQSIDIVAVPPDPALLSEARRVAKAAVVTATLATNEARVGPVFGVEWRMDGIAGAPTASLIVSGPEDPSQVARYLEALRCSMPRDTQGEILLCADWPRAEEAEALGRSWAGTGFQLQMRPGAGRVGYGACCNAAAADATGEVLVFLSSLLPLDGWLPALLETLRVRPEAAAVGGKVLAADGCLEQAGGVVFSDASTACFGDADYEVEDPLYSYVREVDYTADGLLATPRARFHELGGLDPAYNAAPYCHADYSFRARARGFRIYYQPECIGVSIPGRRRGAPTGEGRRNDMSDRDIFAEKWQRLLEAQPTRRHWRDRDTWQSLAVRGGCAAEDCR